MTVLHYAVQYKLTKVVREIYWRLKIDCTIQNREGKTLLHLAAECPNQELIDSILSIPQIDITIEDNQCCIALDVSIESNNIFWLNPLIIDQLLIWRNITLLSIQYLLQ